MSAGPGCTTAADPSKLGPPKGTSPGTNQGGETKPENPGPGSKPGPGDSTKPGEEPGQGGDSGNTDKPGNPGKPGEPEEPGGPDDPDDPGQPEPEPDCKDGEIDENCHALPDGTEIQFPSGVPLGNCQAGTRECKDGKWGACKGAIAPLSEDDCEKKNDDSDCDGVPNAGCDCVKGDTRECGESNVGACQMGEQRCVDGKWDDECVDAIYPEKEVCDGKGIDEDCDGKADIKDSECACINEDEEYCERSGQKGDCKWGKKTCTDGKWSKCKVWAKKINERCGKRDPVEGVIWTGDENCSGKVDESPVGEPGPAGCEPMMLDQDGDGWGMIGPDLAKLHPKDEPIGIGTACLCPNRPDIDEKIAQGWTALTSRANRDCGDCRPGRDGDVVFPGSRATATRSNACLLDTGWHDSAAGGFEPLDYDLNCDGVHTDPNNADGSIAQLRCAKSGAFTCAPSGAGRLLGDPGDIFRCGRTYSYGRCEARIEWIEVEESDIGYTGEDDDADNTTGNDPGTTTKKPKKKKKKKVFRGCIRKRASGSYTIRCQ